MPYVRPTTIPSCFSKRSTVMSESIEYEYDSSFLDEYLNAAHVSGTLILLVLSMGLLAWIPPLHAFLKSRRHKIKITDQRVIVESGIFGTDFEEIELFRIKDTSSESSMMSRLGTVTIYSADVTADDLELHVPDPRAVREKIRSLSRDAKERKGVEYKEAM